MPKLGGRQRRAIPLYNTNADLFIDDGEDDIKMEVEQQKLPISYRNRRAADPGNQDNNRSNRNNQEITYKPLDFARNDYQANRGGGNNGGGNRARVNNGGNRSNSQRGNGSYMNGKSDSRESALDKLVKEIRQKVKDTKKFWSNLPYTVCNHDDFAPTQNADNCWNGNTVNR